MDLKCCLALSALADFMDGSMVIKARASSEASMARSALNHGGRTSMTKLDPAKNEAAATAAISH